jgi:hypothetical protein
MFINIAGYHFGLSRLLVASESFLGDCAPRRPSTFDLTVT